MTLVRRDWFAEALAVFELMHRGAEGEVAEEIARWHRLLRDSHSAPHGDHGDHERAAEGEPAAADGEPRKRRRRRRGGRRRRGNGGGESPLSSGVAAKSET